MDREEILERSRREKLDEGMIQAENRGNRLAMTILTVLFCFFAVFNYVFDYSNAIPMAMYGGYIVAEAYGKYRFDGKKRHIVWMSCGALCVLICSVCHISEVMGTL